MGLSDRAFSIKCGIAQNTLSRQLGGAREVSLTTICAVLDKCPEISAEWLMRGKGEMLLTSEQPDAEDRMNKLIDTIAFQQDTIKNYKNLITDLENKNRLLEEELTIFKNNKLIG